LPSKQPAHNFAVTASSQRQGPFSKITVHDSAAAPYLSIKVHANTQPKIQQRPLAVWRLQLHTAHHFQPRASRLLAVRLLPLLRSCAGWIAIGGLLLWVV
jgi:hypothetical protein